MAQNRKYQNGQIINVSKPNAYGFVKILIRRKEKSSKQHPETKYLCDTYMKGGVCVTAWVITEKDIDELVGNAK